MKTVEEVARRLVWWKTPDKALLDTNQLLTRVMSYGSLSDVQTMLARYGRQAFVATLREAPPGIFDARSWAYWHLVLDVEFRPMPVRTFRTPVLE